MTSCKQVMASQTNNLAILIEVRANIWLSALQYRLLYCISHCNSLACKWSSSTLHTPYVDIINRHECNSHFPSNYLSSSPPIEQRRSRQYNFQDCYIFYYGMGYINWDNGGSNKLKGRFHPIPMYELRILRGKACQICLLLCKIYTLWFYYSNLLYNVLNEYVCLIMSEVHSVETYQVVCTNFLCIRLAWLFNKAGWSTLSNCIMGEVNVRILSNCVQEQCLWVFSV